MSVAVRPSPAVPDSLRVAAIVVALVALTGLAGCGRKTLAKDAYIAKVDPICQKYRDRSKTIAEPKADDVPGVAAYYVELADLADEQTQEIDAVGRPKTDKAKIDDLVERQRDLAGRLRQLAAAVRANDRTKANQIGDAAQPIGMSIDTDLKAFGFTICGSSA